MQTIFGEGAGGRPEIAGSPRGIKYTKEDLFDVARKVALVIKEIDEPQTQNNALSNRGDDEEVR